MESLISAVQHYQINTCQSVVSLVGLQNSRLFLKISKQIGKAWRKSLARGRVRRESLPSLALCFQPRFVQDLLFDYSSVLEYAKTRTVLQFSLVSDKSILAFSFKYIHRNA